MEKRVFETKFEAVEIDREAKRIKLQFREENGGIVQVNMPIVNAFALTHRISITMRNEGCGEEVLKEVWSTHDPQKLKDFIEANGGEWEEV